MPQYRYKAINAEGQYTNGRIAAENPAELATLLRVS